MDIWLIRHGESLSNAGHVTAHTASVPLTARGQEQAQALADHVTMTPNLCVTTPYIRTAFTAAPLVNRYPEMRREVWPLHEFDCLSHARFQSTTMAERAPFVKEFWDRADPDFVDGAGAESFNSLLARLQKAQADLCARDERFTVIFTHGRIMQAMRFLLTHGEAEMPKLMPLLGRYSRTFLQENCGVLRLQRRDGRLMLHEEEEAQFRANLARLMTAAV
jgi:broad specificity phosphatase PhoE